MDLSELALQLVELLVEGGRRRPVDCWKDQPSVSLIPERRVLFFIIGHTEQIIGTMALACRVLLRYRDL